MAGGVVLGNGEGVAVAVGEGGVAWAAGGAGAVVVGAAGGAGAVVVGAAGGAAVVC